MLSIMDTKVTITDVYLTDFKIPHQPYDEQGVLTQYSTFTTLLTPVLRRQMAGGSLPGLLEITEKAFPEGRESSH